MYFCYLDESGGAEPPNESPSATPVMIILGLIVHADHVPELTRDFLALKRRHFPDRFSRGPALDHILTEIKGNHVLKLTRKDSRNDRRQAWRLRDDLLDLVAAYGCRLVGRVWVKMPGKGLKPAATYGYAVQDISRHFSHHLLGERSTGLVIADCRNQPLNVDVAHGIFTQKWRTGGDPYPLLREIPTFSHSNNHAGLQLADMIASTLIFPMAVAAYGAPPGCVHASPRYEDVRQQFAGRVRALQYIYRDDGGRRRGGIVVSDIAGKRPGSVLFTPRAP